MREVIMYRDNSNQDIAMRYFVDDNGVMNGQYHKYFQDGDVEIGYYKDGQLDGPYRRGRGYMCLKGAFVKGKYINGHEAYLKSMQQPHVQEAIKVVQHASLLKEHQKTQDALLQSPTKDTKPFRIAQATNETHYQFGIQESCLTR